MATPVAVTPPVPNELVQKNWSTFNCFREQISSLTSAEEALRLKDTINSTELGTEHFQELINLLIQKWHSLPQPVEDVDVEELLNELTAE